MAAFNLADVLRETNAQDLGQAGREQIQYIDIDLIDPDPKNFYELSDLDELAANIELVGLQQPLRVRNHPEDPDRWMIVSGHRRRAAIRQLVDEGKDQLRTVACIVEQPAGSEALQELRLIYANSDTRRMTSAEISKQADRVEMLLYELKEQGMEFPGRMRDHVAEACKVSKSKLSRLKVIREKLRFGKEAFERDDISESAAYALAQQPEDIQAIVWQSGYNDTGHIQEWHVKSAVNRIEKIDAIQCNGHPCENRENMYSRSLRSNQYDACYQCCEFCHNFLSCSKVCTKLKAKQKEQKKNGADQKQQWAAAEKQRKQAEAAEISEAWRRLGGIVENRGIALDRAAEALASYEWERKSLRAALQGEKQHRESQAPFGVPGKKLTALADLLGVTTDYLLGRSETPQPPTATLESTESWRDYDTAPLPDENEETIVLYQLTPNTKLETKIAYFRDGHFRSRDYHVMVPNVRFWQPYHDPNKNVPESGTEGGNT